MTEFEWSECSSALEMLYYLKSGAGKASLREVFGQDESERKMRLFLIACCRRIWSMMSDERSREAVRVAEKFANGLVDGSELEKAHNDAAAAYVAIRKTKEASAYCAACCAEEVSRLEIDWKHGLDFCIYGADVASRAAAKQATQVNEGEIYKQYMAKEDAIQAEFLRDIFTR